MQFIDWTEEMSVGVGVLDDDHKRLIDMLNSLFDAGKTSDSREHLVKLLDELMDYTNVHFSREEECMRKAGYPDFEAHKAAHAYFVGQVHDLKREYDAENTLMLKIDIILILNEWLVNHIQTTDMKYRPFIEAAG